MPPSQEVRKEAIRYCSSRPEFAHLTDGKGHRCQWLVVAYLELHRLGRPFDAGDVLALRDRLVPVSQRTYWDERGGEKDEAA